VGRHPTGAGRVNFPQADLQLTWVQFHGLGVFHQSGRQTETFIRSCQNPALCDTLEYYLPELMILDVATFTGALNDAELAMLALAQTIDARGDGRVDVHCHRLAILSVALAQTLGLSPDEQFALFCGGYLHDIGKVDIPDAIRFKNGRLTRDEFTVMQGHTGIGERICRPVRSFSRTLPIIRNHHERWDGTGYPDRLYGEGIPLLARIMQISDIYDALTTARPYRRALQHEDAFGEMSGVALRNQLDPQLVRLIGELPVADLDAIAINLPLSLVETRSGVEQSGGKRLLREVEFYSCFISHSSNDESVARRINEDLRTRGITSWYAPEDLKIGDALRSRIDESIRLHDKLLLILSRSSVASKWVESEVEAAFEEERHRSEKKPEGLRGSVTVLFPIMIDDAVFESASGWVANVRRTRHIGDFRGWQDPARYDAALKRLLRDLAASDEEDNEAREARKNAAARLRQR